MKDMYEKKRCPEMQWWRYVKENMKYYRRLKDWTQADLAEKIGCGNGKIKGLEQGTIKFTQVSLDELCRALDISIDLLFIPHTHYLTRISPSDHARIKSSLPNFYSVLKDNIENFSTHYVLGIVNTYNYNQYSQKVCYETADLLKITHPALSQHKNLLLNILKTHIEKEYISSVGEDLLKEKRASCFAFNELKEKIHPLYKLFSHLIESCNLEISTLLRIPILIQDSRDLFGGIWVCLSDGGRIKKERLISIEEEIYNVIWGK